MARTADKPGTFRIVPKRGAYMLTGVRANGARVKVPGLTRVEAEEMSTRLFTFTPTGQTGTFKSDVDPTKVLPPLDDYGLPLLKASPSVVASTAPPPQPTPSLVTKPPVVDEEKKVARAKQARSLMELAGICWATGDVWIGRKITERADCEPVAPNPRQVNDLKDSVKETLTEWFGDKEIKPWQMMFLLTIAIPASMLIQSPKRPKPVEAKGQDSSEKLRSV